MTLSGLWSVSGRADCSPTGKSNVGLNTRFLDANLASRIWSHLKTSSSHRSCYFKHTVKDLLQDETTVITHIDSLVGTEARKALQRGLELLGKKFPTVTRSKTAYVIGPTIEGIGLYPILESTLRIPESNCFVAGDGKLIMLRLTRFYWRFYCNTVAADHRSSATKLQ
jgi:hypothetical protein